MTDHVEIGPWTQTDHKLFLLVCESCSFRSFCVFNLSSTTEPDRFVPSWFEIERLCLTVKQSCSKALRSVGGDVSFLMPALNQLPPSLIVGKTYKQWTTVRPSPPSYSSCHLSTCRISLRKERLDMGVSLYIGQPRNWNCCTIR